MKIFNWVHGRFNNHKDDELAKDANSRSDHQLISDHEISIDIDQTQFVVKNNNVNVFSGWKGGILTIGTFGYNPLKDEESHDDEELHVNIDWHSGNDQGTIIPSDKEKVSSHMESDIDQVIIDSDDCEEEEDEVKPLMMHAAAVYAHEDLLKMEEISDEIEEAVEVLVLKKERTTLAELFYAEKSEEQKGNEKQRPIAIAGEKTLKTKANSCDKNRISSSAAKKKSSGQDSTARPMGKRLHRMVRKMLKKKIHPELGLNNSSKHVDYAAAKRAEDTREFDSLLPIQGAVI